MSSAETQSPLLGQLAVLIPAWQPEQPLYILVESLAADGFGAIVIVDDGSGAEYESLFASLHKVPSVVILHHAVNLGKGRALKTGINYILSELPLIQGVITADADGQHAPCDIIRVGMALDTSSSRTVLGVRSFVQDVPLRSRIGNSLTRQVFGFMTGARLSDTQTGLRAFARASLAELLVLRGERYEYEMTVLAHLCRDGRRPLELPIQTIYIDGNRASHFDPVRDSMRIYFVLLRFYFSSLLASGIDLAGFTLTFAATHNLWLSVVLGRLSSIVNFALNKTFVFHSRRSVQGSLWRYYGLAILIAAASYGLIWAATRYLHWNVFAAKITVDVVLSLVSFSVQQTFVFRRDNDAA
jgi:glycosyltransferase involved in cell wall biosynthesis